MDGCHPWGTTTSQWTTHKILSTPRPRLAQTPSKAYGKSLNIITRSSTERTELFCQHMSMNLFGGDDLVTIHFTPSAATLLPLIRVVLDFKVIYTYHFFLPLQLFIWFYCFPAPKNIRNIKFLVILLFWVFLARRFWRRKISIFPFSK